MSSVLIELYLSLSASSLTAFFSFLLSVTLCTVDVLFRWDLLSYFCIVSIISALVVAYLESFIPFFFASCFNSATVMDL